MTASRNECGFTLLELLIAIAILGLIIVALTGGVRFAGQVWEANERQSAKHGDLDAVQNVLRELIAPGRGFNGDGVSLRFVGSLPDALARGGLYDIDLRTVADRLVLSWKPHFRGPTAPAAPNSTDLTTGVTSVELTYHVAPVGWQRAARNGNRPPALIRIALQLSDGRVWPPLTIAPMVEARSSVTK